MAWHDLHLLCLPGLISCQRVYGVFRAHTEHKLSRVCLLEHTEGFWGAFQRLPGQELGAAGAAPGRDMDVECRSGLNAETSDSGSPRYCRPLIEIKRLWDHLKRNSAAEACLKGPSVITTSLGQNEGDPQTNPAGGRTETQNSLVGQGDNETAFPPSLWACEERNITVFNLWPDNDPKHARGTASSTVIQPKRGRKRSTFPPKQKQSFHITQWPDDTIKEVSSHILSQRQWYEKVRPGHWGQPLASLYTPGPLSKPRLLYANHQPIIFLFAKLQSSTKSRYMQLPVKRVTQAEHHGMARALNCLTRTASVQALLDWAKATSMRSSSVTPNLTSRAWFHQRHAQIFQSKHGTSPSACWITAALHCESNHTSWDIALMRVMKNHKDAFIY